SPELAVPSISPCLAPRSSMWQPASAKQLATGGQPDLKNDRSIGVVDDDPKIIRLVKGQLEKDGYKVVTAGDGPAAVDLVETTDLDLLVLDVMLPGMDGCDVLRRI